MVSATVIYYAIYMIWLILLMLDWTTIERTLTQNSELILWSIVIGLILFLLIFSILATLYAGGKDIVGLSGSTFALIIMGLTFSLVGVLAFNYWIELEQINTIRFQLASRQLLPLIYVHGRNSEDISQRLGLGRSSITPRRPLTITQMWNRIGQKSNPAKKIKSLNRLILGCDFNGTDSEQYAFFWYCCLSEDPTRTNLTPSQIRKVVGMNLEELRELWGRNYTGASDRASLLFSTLSGQIIPDPEFTLEQQNRYQAILDYPPGLVWSLVFGQNKMIDSEAERASVHSPHVVLALEPASMIEQLLLKLNPTEYDEYIHQFGLGTPTLELSRKEIHNFIVQNLCQYTQVLTRPLNLMLPPALTGMIPSQIRHTLSYYTNAELIEAYEPRGSWLLRNELIDFIIEDITGQAKWALTHRFCNNDHTMNILTGEIHGEVNKDDLEDPTLSYGHHRNYQCYQASELQGVFRIYDGIFLFRVPDWVSGNPNPSEFSLDSIKQLQTFLDSLTSIRSLEPLRNKIREGLEFYQSAQMQTLQIKRRYDSFTLEQQRLIQQYLAWMFMDAMWMRFWKGPGHAWPMRKVNIRRAAIRAAEDRASPQERDEHIFIQEGVRTALIELYETDPIVTDWINTLPTIYYDFETEDARPATHPVKTTLDQIARGDYCMGFGSDTILKTSYYYIRNVLEKNKGQFDQFMLQMMPVLMDMEYHVITAQIGNVTDGARAQILRDRLQAIQTFMADGGASLIQPPFVPSTYQNNVHID